MSDWEVEFGESQPAQEHEGTRFPAKAHVCRPEDGQDPLALDVVEEPYLLNPFRDNPKDHLMFTDEGGVGARNEDRRGRESIQILRLNRGALVNDRQFYQQAAWSTFTRALRKAADEGCELGDPLKEYREGRLPFSTAALQHVHRKYDELEERSRAALPKGHDVA